MRLKQAGLQSSVLNIDPRAPMSNAYVKISGPSGFAWQLFQHVSDDWSLNVHTNGHNRKSWLIALLCGIAGQIGPGATLTLHSGGIPAYLRTRGDVGKWITRVSCLLYTRITCVNTEIAETLAGLGIPRDRMDVEPAFVPFQPPDVVVPEQMDSWMRSRIPLLSSAIFFRPEYGFELLVQAIRQLRQEYPKIGCFVMGSGEGREQATLLTDDSFYLAGDVDHDLCLTIMSRSAVFVRPTYMDGDSISVREAISLGVPVVASDVGQRPEEVVLFRAGDVQALVDGLRTTLAGSGASNIVTKSE
jgi:glycosyltransferase involved in cell wall biosynthesis